MHFNTLSKLILTGTVIVAASAGVAQNAYSNYEQASAAVRAQFEKGDYATAQKTAEQALALAQTPEDKAEALLNLGLSYDKRKLYDQAREQWQKLLELPQLSAHDKFGALYVTALSYFEEEKLERSRADFERILADPQIASPDKTQARFGIAATYLNGKQSEQARQTLFGIAQDAALASLERATAYIQLATILSGEKQFEQARAALVSARALPELPAEAAVLVQAGIARTYQDAGDAAQAKEQLGQAQEMALTQYQALSDDNQFKEARAMLELFLTLREVKPVTEIGVKMQIGYLLQKEGKSAQAREVFQAVAQKPDDPTLTTREATVFDAIRQSARLGIAETYVQEQNKDQAQKVLKMLLDSNNLDSGVQRAAQQLLQTLE